MQGKSLARGWLWHGDDGLKISSFSDIHLVFCHFCQDEHVEPLMCQRWVCGIASQNEVPQAAYHARGARREGICLCYVGQLVGNHRFAVAWMSTHHHSLYLKAPHRPLLIPKVGL